MDVLSVCDVTTLLMMTIVNVFGNSLVVISVRKFDWLQSPTHYLIALLAYFDLCNGVPVFVSRRIVEVLEDVPTNSTLNYNTACRVQSILIVFAAFGEGFCILMIAIDRFVFLNWPLRYHQLITTFTAKIMTSCCLVAAVTVSLFVLLSDQKEHPKPCLMSNVLLGTTMYIIIPVGMATLVAVALLYAKIFQIAYKARRYTRPLDHMSNLNPSVSRNSKTKIMACMTAIFIITYLTYTSVHLGTRNSSSPLGVTLQVVAIWITRVSGVRNGSKIHTINNTIIQ